VKNEDRFLELVPINLNKLKKEDKLHIYDTYRAYLQTQEEFTLEIKIMESKVEIISHKPCKTKSHLCETLELVNKNLYPNIYCILKILLTMPPSTATKEIFFSVLKRVKTYYVFRRHNGTGMTIAI
jgi:hypothetical protein